MRAKAKLPGFAQGILSVDVSADGNWVLATCEQYLMLFNVLLDDGTCFTKRVAAANKPKPFRLCLRKRDILRFGMKDIRFTPAKFDTGANMSESWIITTT